MRRIAALCFALFSGSALWAQKVEMMVDGNVAPMTLHTTQTEIRPGWKISDVQLDDRVTRYLWGKHATQLADTNRPTFVITPGQGETLVQYAVMRLRHKRDSRAFFKPQLGRNNYTRITPEYFHIEAHGDESFLCRPSKPLKPGDYILINIEQRPVGEMGDYICYPFRVE